MSSVKCNDDLDEQEKKSKLYKLTRPLRNLTFPIGCLIFCVFYWFIMVPIVYSALDASCRKPDCTWGNSWKAFYWATASFLFVAILTIAICCWCCLGDRDDEKKGIIKVGESKGQQKENDKLLGDQVKYNNLKNETLTSLSIKNEKKTPAKEKTDQSNSSVTNSEDKAEKKTSPIRKSITEKEEVIIKEKETPVDDSKEKQSAPPQNDIPKEGSMMEEIDKLFPRCSTRRKPETRKRPDTLIIHSPKYPREEHEIKRYTVQEHPRAASPLTPREMFFYDLIQGAKKQTIQRTENFLENERKHSSNNYTSSKKPEIKDFILKQRSNTEASSPEYFIANVPQRSSCTTEAFIYVDGGQPEETLTICYIDRDDDVFQS